MKWVDLFFGCGDVEHEMNNVTILCGEGVSV